MTHRTLSSLLVLAALASFAPAAAATGDDSPVARGAAPMTEAVAADLGTLPSVTPYGVFVHFGSGSLPEQRALLGSHGMTVTAEFTGIDVLFAVGTVGDVRGLTREPAVAYLEENRATMHLNDTAGWATRSRVAQEAVVGGPYRDEDGDVLDGTGVGIAIVDSGVDATHPDLMDHVAANIKVVCTTPLLINTNTGMCFGPLAFVDVGAGASTDTTAGHGTHVAGIAAGDGTASTGTYTGGVTPAVPGTFAGAAPEASIFGFGTGEGASILYAAEAYQYILDNYDDLTPRIRVVNNSWGSISLTGATLNYDPNSVVSKLVKQLIAKGVTVTFAAGNGGGTGTQDRTSPESKDPTPGVISVANYDDAGTGERDNVLSTSSSRGRSGQPTTYPDISAPGSLIVSTCRPGTNMVDCADASAEWPGFYSFLSGTSMATPHVTGVSALLYQARPGLTPAQVEDVLLDTAYKFTSGAAYGADPQNPGGTNSFDKGAGLVNTPAALNALGVDHGTSSGQAPTPEVRITEPGEASVFDGSASIPVQGTANDGTSPTSPPPTQLLVAGDADDFDGPGAADIDSLSVTETPAGVSPAGLTFTIGLRNASNFQSTGVTLQVSQTVEGADFLTRVNTTSTSVTPDTSTTTTARATSASRSGNTLSFFVPFTNLGNPPSGSPGYRVSVSSLIGTVVDVAPGSSQAAVADFLTRPQFARPYSILRPQVVVPPTASLTLSVDGAPTQAVSLTGSSPEYAWSASVDPSLLPDGPHTLTATLLLNGMPAATHVVTFVIDRTPPPRTYDVVITSPREGDEVPRAVIQVRGTSATDDPSTDRRVSIEVLGTVSTTETDAVGTAPWSLDVDFDRAPGPYTILARYYVGGSERARHEVHVVVPPPSGGAEVSCAPRSMGFWRQQFDTKDSSRKFTVAEAETLADHAVSLSGDYFADSATLLVAVAAQGNKGAEARAARQYAALLLNLAAGDLSASMSYRVGFSGQEPLDPAVFDTGTVGATVDDATAWVRAQLPGGSLGSANEVADALNNGQGLLC